MRFGMGAMLAIGGVLVALGVLYATNNPTIAKTDVGAYQCFAPYDTVLFGDRNDVGMHADAQSITERCDAANQDRFALGSVSAAAGAVIIAIATGSRLRRRRHAA